MPRIKYLDLKIRMSGRMLINQVNDIKDATNA
jgi:hypothetical protein